MPSLRTFSELPTTHPIVFSRTLKKWPEIANPNALQKAVKKLVKLRLMAKIG